MAYTIVVHHTLWVRLCELYSNTAHLIWGHQDTVTDIWLQHYCNTRVLMYMFFLPPASFYNTVNHTKSHHCSECNKSSVWSPTWDVQHAPAVDFLSIAASISTDIKKHTWDVSPISAHHNNRSVICKSLSIHTIQGFCGNAALSWHSQSILCATSDNTWEFVYCTKSARNTFASSHKQNRASTLWSL